MSCVPVLVLALSASPVTVSVESDSTVSRTVGDRVLAELVSAGYRVRGDGGQAVARIQLVGKTGVVEVHVEVPQALKTASRAIPFTAGDALALTHVAVEVVDVLRATLLEGRLGVPTSAEEAPSTAEPPATEPPAAPEPEPVAAAQREWSARVEALGWAPLSAPQTSSFGFGGGARAAGFVSLREVFDASAHVGTVYVTPAAGAARAKGGSVSFGGVGGRFHWSAAERSWAPLIAVELSYGRTGQDSLFGFALTAGVQWQLGAVMAIGPHLQLNQWFPLNEAPGFTLSPATFLGLGVGVELASAAPTNRESAPQRGAGGRTGTVIIQQQEEETP